MLKAGIPLKADKRTAVKSPEQILDALKPILVTMSNTVIADYEATTQKV